jgi:hypothetical protein
MRERLLREWFRQHANQRKLAVGLLILGFGCFAQALWIEVKGEWGQVVGGPSPEAVTLVACYTYRRRRIPSAYACMWKMR